MVTLLKKNLLLTGMMGVGKSTVGKKLAKKLKLKFIDIDKLLKKREKRQLKKFLKIMVKIILEWLKK